MPPDKKRGIRLYSLLLLSILGSLVPFSILLAVLYYRELSRAVLKGFDSRLDTATSAASAFLDADSHLRLADYRQIRSLARLPDGVVGLTGVGGEIRFLPAGGRVFEKVGAVKKDVQDIAWMKDRLFVAPVEEASLILFRRRGRNFEFDGTLSIPQVCTGIAPLPDGERLLCTGESWLILDGNGIDLESVPVPFEISNVTSATTASDGIGILSMGDEGEARLILLSGDLKRILEDHQLKPSQALFGMTRLGESYLFTGSRGFEFWRRGSDTPGYTNLLPGEMDRKILPIYNRSTRALQTLRSSLGLTYLFTGILVKDGRYLQYTLDSTQDQYHSMDGMVDPTEVEEGIRDVWFKGESYQSGIKYWEDWGLLKSGYRPLKSNGSVTGIVGADVDIGIIEKRRKAVLASVILLATLSTGLAVMILWFLGRAFVRPMEKLRREILWIAAGGAAISGMGGEFPALNGLYSRLEEMRREIDREKTRYSRDRRILTRKQRRKDG